MNRFLLLITVMLVGFTSCQQDAVIDKPQKEDSYGKEEVLARALVYRAPTDAEKAILKQKFPALNVDNVTVTGEASPFYNCISLAMGLNNKWINPFPILHEFQAQFINANERYSAPTNFSVTITGVSGAAVDGWGHGSSSMTHASRHHYSSLHESKCGRYLQITHERYGLQGASYGNILTSFEKRNSKSLSELSDLAAEVAQKDIKISVNDKQDIAVKTTKISSYLKVKFNKLFEEWLEEWRTNPKTLFSSNTYDAANLPQFEELKAMGDGIIPLVVEKLAEPENFVGLILYDALQKDEKLKISYTGLDASLLEGEQNRAARTVQKWLINQE